MEPVEFREHQVQQVQLDLLVQPELQEVQGQLVRQVQQA
jgi:hypothetical protein